MIMTNKRTTGGSGLRAFLAPGSGMEKIIKTRSKIREEYFGSYFRELSTGVNFWVP
jgi:hypothetical protein